MRAFLEKINKEWLDDFVYCSKQPLIDRDIEVIPFDTVLYEGMADLLRHTPTKKDVIFASVDACQTFFKATGVKEPSYIGYPLELEKFLHRTIRTTTFKELCAEADYYAPVELAPFFVKPKQQVKLFTGALIENRSQWNTFSKFFNVPADAELYVSSPINIASEYRCFVYKNAKNSKNVNPQ